ncbi:MAG: type II secretion system F family protein [Gemmataceae bacterium]
MTEFILLFVIVILVVGVIMGAFAGMRGLHERRQAYITRRLPTPEPEGALIGSLPRKDSPKWDEQVDEAFERLVHRTGLGWSTQEALGWVLVAGVAIGGLFLLWTSQSMVAGIGLILGMAVPLVIYLILQRRWRNQLQKQLPDTFFLLARSLRAGLSLEQAFDNVANHGAKPIAAEFKRGVEQMKLGLTVAAALQGMARRIQLLDFDVFVTIVSLHRNIGGNLTLLLDRVAISTRDRDQFRGQVRAATALSRVTAFAVALGAPLIFIGYAIWQPEFIERFTESASGNRALSAAILLEIIGICWLAVLLRERA